VAGTQAATASLDVCALITPTEAATIMGIGNPLPMPQAIAGAVPGCTFQSDGAEELKLFVHRYPSLDEALKAQQVSVDRIKQQPSFQRITGIGDEAFAMGNSLAVRKQAVIITISLITTKTPAANLLRKQSLAQTLLERLP
jgi:hypothetical protein